MRLCVVFSGAVMITACSQPVDCPAGLSKNELNVTVLGTIPAGTTLELDCESGNDCSPIESATGGSTQSFTTVALLDEVAALAVDQNGRAVAMSEPVKVEWREATTTQCGSTYSATVTIPDLTDIEQ